MKYTLKENYSDEEIAIYHGLKSFKNSHYFIAESDKLVTSLLESELEITSLYLTQEHLDGKRSLIEAHIQSTPCHIYLAQKEEMEKIVGYSLHQGILASAQIPQSATIETVMASSTSRLFVILDEIADAENMGTLFRTSLALGVTAMILDGKSISPWNRRAVRVSMGAVFSLPIISTSSLPESIQELREKGVMVYAATVDAGAESTWDSNLRSDIAIVFGSEGHGIKREVLDVCDMEITIPMPDAVDSLNVGVAQGIILYEVLRQRKI